MGKADVIVIGGGFAGLTCALALVKTGKRVLVLEKEPVPGGAFQSFRRRGHMLETGFHYVGGVGEGEVMRPLITFFGLEDLPWQRLDDDFLEMHRHGKTFTLLRGYNSFAEALSKRFPDEKPAIDEFVCVMRDINEHIYETVLPSKESQMSKLMAVSAKPYLENHFRSPELRDILCGQSLTTELTDELPLYSFVQSLNSFIQGAYRLRGGGETLINKLVENLLAAGGELLTRKSISGFTLGENGDVSAVLCSDGSEYSADIFISTLHPAQTMALIPECPQIRGVARRRLQRLQNTVGMFTVQLALKPGTVPYRNRSISILESDDLWHTPCGTDDPVRNMLVSYNVPSEGDFAAVIDLLTPMSWEAVSEWADSTVGHRPEAYKDFKRRKAEECITFATHYIPELQGNIEEYWTSTPLTYRDYTGIPQGSAFGVRKSCMNLIGTVTSPVTAFPNLYLAGQNLMLHGMLGTAMSSMLTCNLICGRNLLED
jgi:phytoene dehydrogenase-like protein